MAAFFQVLFLAVLFAILSKLPAVAHTAAYLVSSAKDVVALILAAAGLILALVFQLMRPFPFLEVVDADDEDCFYLVIEPRQERAFQLSTATVEAGKNTLKLWDIPCAVMIAGDKKPQLERWRSIEHQTVLKVEKDDLRQAFSVTKGTPLGFTVGDGSNRRTSSLAYLKPRKDLTPAAPKEREQHHAG